MLPQMPDEAKQCYLNIINRDKVKASNEKSQKYNQKDDISGETITENVTTQRPQLKKSNQTQLRKSVRVAKKIKHRNLNLNRSIK